MSTESKVFYSAFGAVGDGVADDFAAIKAAHDYANGKKLPVFADKGATYYINRTGGAPINIMTDTDWTGASFVIDDRNLVDGDIERKAGIFFVISEYTPYTVDSEAEGKAGETIRALNASAEKNGGLVFKRDSLPKIDLGLGYPAMLVIKNSTKNQYIRYGGNANKGSEQHEIIMVDKDGNADPSTPILHDFPLITSILVRRIDDTPITVRGGVFTTRANQCPETYAYYMRGIKVQRANTTLTNIEHYITDEGEHGNPYSAFFRFEDTCNVTMLDSVVTGHRVYDGMSSVSVTPMGTYDISAGNACNVLWRGLVQSNFYHLDENGNPTDRVSTSKNDAGIYYWGVMGSNYCKNLIYESCKLTRFDAHCGTYNARIKDSEICVLSIIGGGTLHVSNTKIHSTGTNVMTLRGDYGSTFSGDVVLENTTFKTTSTSDNINLIAGGHYNHDFGYETFLPYTVTLDNFKVESPVEVKTVSIFTGSVAVENINGPILSNGEKNINPMVPTKKITVKNNTMGYEYINPNTKNAETFKDTVFEIL